MAIAQLPGEPESDLIAELLRRTQERPNDLAIIDGPQRVTYQELWAGIETCAAWLRQVGVASGDRVALVAENSAEYLTWAAAVWRAGAVLVTIYPSSTRNDLTYCLESCDPVLVLADEHTEASVRRAAGADVPVAVISRARDAVALRQAVLDNPETPGGRLGLICYTSGTTSRPKAVMVSVEALHNGATTYADLWHLGPADRTVVALPMAWLYGLDSTSFATLVRGGTVIVLRRGRPELMAEAISTHRATFLPGVTTMFTKLVDYLDSSATKPDLTSLRVCLSAGEPRNERAFSRWRDYTG
jgi:long-chain acyl-CoA synthetase